MLCANVYYTVHHNPAMACPGQYFVVPKTEEYEEAYIKGVVLMVYEPTTLVPMIAALVRVCPYHRIDMITPVGDYVQYTISFSPRLLDIEDPTSRWHYMKEAAEKEKCEVLLLASHFDPAP